MNNLTQQKLTKLLELELPDDMSDDRTMAIYRSFDSEVIIYQNYETDEYLVAKKSDPDKHISETEILVWIKEKSRILIEHVKSGNGIKSTNFVQDNGCDPRKLPKDLKLSNKTKIDIANAIIQEMHPKLDAMTDEQLLEELQKIQAQYLYCQQYLQSRNIKVRETARKKQNEEYEANKLSKAARLAKKEAKANKPKLTREQKAMDNMGLDYNNPADVTKYQAFLKSLGD